MLLAIDSGNTNTTFALLDAAGPVRGIWRTSTNSRRTADEYAVWLFQLMALKELDRRAVRAVIIANVVPDLAFNLDRLCRAYFELKPLNVGDPDVALGIEAKVEQPAEVGADRLVNAVAAHAAYGGPLVVIDFGTATTFDVVGARGDYLGGPIAPGINLSLEALYMAAAKLPGIAVKRPPKVIGTNTVHAMQSGVYWGYVGLIEGLVGRIEAEYRLAHPEDSSRTFQVIGTGGLAPLFGEATRAIHHLDGDLTMRGLHLIWQRNGGR